MRRGCRGSVTARRCGLHRLAAAACTSAQRPQAEQRKQPSRLLSDDSVQRGGRRRSTVVSTSHVRDGGCTAVIVTCRLVVWWWCSWLLRCGAVDVVARSGRWSGVRSEAVLGRPASVAVSVGALSESRARTAVRRPCRRERQQLCDTPPSKRTDPQPLVPCDMQLACTAHSCQCEAAVGLALCVALQQLCLRLRPLPVRASECGGRQDGTRTAPPRTDDDQRQRQWSWYSYDRRWCSDDGWAGKGTLLAVGSSEASSSDGGCEKGCSCSHSSGG